MSVFVFLEIPAQDDCATELGQQKILTSKSLFLGHLWLFIVVNGCWILCLQCH
jgi:hypothetical protein